MRPDSRVPGGGSDYRPCNAPEFHVSTAGSDIQDLHCKILQVDYELSGLWAFGHEASSAVGALLP